MIVSVNGEARELPDHATVDTIVAGLRGPGGDGRGIAVAVAGEVVPRTGWSERRLRDGESVEVLIAVQGG